MLFKEVNINYGVMNGSVFVRTGTQREYSWKSPIGDWCSRSIPTHMWTC